MGTDICIYAEVKRNGVWQFIGEMEENREFYPEDNPNAQRYKPVELYNTRNYNLFSILADVRNNNEPKFEFIAPTRGLPEGLSLEITNWSKDRHHGINIANPK